LAPGVARAASIGYTFDSPQFALAQTTPLLNIAPNINPGTFLTSFTDTGAPSHFFEVQGSLQPALFSGQYLIELHGQTDGLILSFNTPVYQLAVDFGLSIAVNDPAGFGSLRIVSSSGTGSQIASNNGGLFQTGLLSFASTTAFTSVTLQGFVSDGVTPIGLAIDNLTLSTTPVPEPTSLSLAVLGIGAVLFGRCRRLSR
jgi:hypothetical protein